MRTMLIAVCLTLGCNHARADTDSVLPPMHFASSVAADELFSALKGNQIFTQLDKEAYGSPILLLVTHSLRPTAAGQVTGLLSAITTGATLGLLPAVTNNNLVVTYSVKVNGRDVASYSYTRTFTRAFNIWNAKNDSTHGLGQEGLDWVKSTAGDFAKDAANDAKLTDLKREFDFYFGSAAGT